MEEIRHKPLGVVSGTSHSKLQPRNGTFPLRLCQVLGREKCCRLVVISYNNKLKIGASGAFFCLVAKWCPTLWQPHGL